MTDSKHGGLSDEETLKIADGVLDEIAERAGKYYDHDGSSTEGLGAVGALNDPARHRAPKDRAK